MRKAIFPVLIILSLIIPACSSLYSNQPTELTQSDYDNLLHYARSVVTQMPQKKLTKSEKAFIQNNLPEKKIVYTGYKNGKVILTWFFESGKEVKYISEGNLMNFPESFKSINIADVKISSSIKGQR